MGVEAPGPAVAIAVATVATVATLAEGAEIADIARMAEDGTKRSRRKPTTGGKSAAPSPPPIASTLPPPPPPVPLRRGRTFLETWDPKAEAAAAKAAVDARVRPKAIKAPRGAMPLPGVVVETLEEGPLGGKLKRRKATISPPIVCPTCEKAKGRCICTPEAKAPKPKRPGRKPAAAMSEAIFLSICLEIAGGTPLREICRRPDMPSKSSFYDWLEDDSDPQAHSGRIARYARARKLGFDNIAEEALEIADDGRNDWIERHDPDNPGYDYNGEHVARSRLRVDTRLKLLAKWDPKGYGERLALSDPDGKPLGKDRSASDLAIDVAKLIVAAKRDVAATGQSEAA